MGRAKKEAEPQVTDQPDGTVEVAVQGDKDAEIAQLKEVVQNLRAAAIKTAEKHHAEVSQLREELEDKNNGLSELWDKLNSFKKLEQEYERQLVERDQAIAELSTERAALLATVEKASEDAVQEEFIPSTDIIGAIKAMLSREEFSGYCKGSIIECIARPARANFTGHAARKAAAYLNWVMEGKQG